MSTPTSPQSEHEQYIAQALPAFVSEAQEQVESVEQLLLQLEDDPHNRALLDALFRCAHTVKGSAGIFGLDQLVAFTHHVESMLDLLREGHLSLTPTLSTLLLQCNDQVRLLIAAAHAPAIEGDAAELIRQGLVQQLQAASNAATALARGALLEPADPGATASQVASAPPETAQSLRSDADDVVHGPWHLSVRFQVDTFRNGMDPLAILNYLRRLGQVPSLVCDMAGVPPLDQIDPESCYLGFELSLDTRATRTEIEAAFSFARDDCTLHLLEPTVTGQDFAALIDAMPDHPRLGEMLVCVGAITPAQLQQGLRAQSEAVAQVGHAAPLGEILQANTGINPTVVSAALQKQQGQRAGRASSSGGATAPDDNRFIRVHADKLDAVINLLGELVIASAGGLLLARQTRQRQLTEANHQISGLVEEIRNGTLQLRMVPIGETFSRFRRVVRDTANELGKEVHLEIVGGDTELDKSVVERIADPLMHLVRNALDHGLETPAERTAVGKPEQGTLTISACHESGSILISIQDDGRGIDRERVLQRAWERGLVEPGVTPPDAEILNLIFEPGFSTAAKLTSLSGRGVGMDVVRRNIEALRGSVVLSSEPGQGSRIALRLPLTLAIIDGFLVGVGPSKFIFPLDAVVEVIETRPTASAVDERGRSVVELRGQVLPVVSLRALYALDSPQPDRSSVVVIQSGGVRFGVTVDLLLGQHQTVIKPLGRMLSCMRGMSGSSILGNGEVALIFDVNSLSQLACVQGTGRAVHPGPTTSREMATSPS